MRKLLLILASILPILVFSQNKIELVTGESFVAEIDGFYGTNLVFKDKIMQLGDDRVNIADVISISGKIPNTRMKAILKKNPKVKFIDNDARIYEPPIGTDENFNPGRQNMYSLSAGDYLQIAGKRYYSGLGIALAGSAVMAISAGSDNNELMYVGAGVSFVGLIVSLTGHAQLIKAGKKLNQEQISIAPSSSGIGLSINF